MKIDKILKDCGKTGILEEPMIIAGPCSIDNFETMDITAEFLHSVGVKYMRGGAFKPRTSPYSFQGLGYEGLEILKEIKAKYDLKIVSEVLDVRDIERMCSVVDVLQIGARNMYNYVLLNEVGKTDKKVILKRGFSATIEEWLNAAEYIALAGNEDIILCERGIRTFENTTRNTLDLSCIPIVKQKTKLKIIVDPSHGTGISELVKPLSLAAIAAGADGIMLEVHPEPCSSFCDADQAINFSEFEEINAKTNELYHFVNNLRTCI